MCFFDPRRWVRTLETLHAQLDAAHGLGDSVPDKELLIARAKRAVKEHIEPRPKRYSLPMVLSFPRGEVVPQAAPLFDPEEELKAILTATSRMRNRELQLFFES